MAQTNKIHRERSSYDQKDHLNEDSTKSCGRFQAGRCNTYQDEVTRLLDCPPSCPFRTTPTPPLDDLDIERDCQHLEWLPDNVFVCYETQQIVEVTCSGCQSQERCPECGDPIRLHSFAGEPTYYLSLDNSSGHRLPTKNEYYVRCPVTEDLRLWNNPRFRLKIKYPIDCVKDSSTLISELSLEGRDSLAFILQRIKETFIYPPELDILFIELAKALRPKEVFAYLQKSEDEEEWFFPYCGGPPDEPD